MPTYKVTDPNTGRVVRLTGDSPPTQQELEQVFAQFQVEEQPPVDDMAARRQEALKALAGEQSPFQAGLIAVGKGMYDVGRGLGLVEPAGETERRAFQALEQEHPVATTIGEVTGQAAPFVVAGTPIGALATAPARIAAAGALGAAEGGIISSGLGGGESDVLQAAGLGGAVAATAEMVLPSIVRVGGRLIRRALGKEPTTTVIDASGRPSQELQEAMRRAGVSWDDLTAEAQRMVSAEDVADPAAVARREFLRGQGIEPTRAQVTGDVTAFQTQEELAKQSGVVRSALDLQEEQLAGRFENAVAATGGSANPSGSPVIDYVADRSIALDQSISNAYRAAREAASNQQVVRPDNLVEAMRSIAGSEQATGGLVGAVRDSLRSRGLIGGKGLQVQGRVTPEVAEQIRIDMNALYNSLSPFGREKLAVLKSALDDDVAAAVGEDVFKEARAAKAKFEGDLSRSKVNKFDRRGKEIIRDILENKINPDRFIDDVVISRGTRADDLLQIKKYLSLDNDEAGKAAWDSMRAQTMEWIRSEAIKEVGGQPAITRDRLERAIKRIGRPKLQALFSADEIKFLDDMLNVTKMREPKRKTQQGLGPSAQAVMKLEGVVKRLPLGFSDLFGGMAVDTYGNKVVIRSPSFAMPAKPSKIATSTALALPAAPAAAVTAQEQ